MTLSYSSVNGAPHFGPFPRLWRTAMAPSDDGPPAFVPVSSPLVAELPAWTPTPGSNVTLPLTERAALVRVLGGWLTSGKAYASEIDDFVDVHVGTQSLRYTWSILWGRVDPVVRAGVEPVFVWTTAGGSCARARGGLGAAAQAPSSPADNVPWGFSRRDGRDRRVRLRARPAGRGGARALLALRARRMPGAR